MRVARFQRRILLLVPYADGRGISESLFDELKRCEREDFEIVDVAVPDPLSERRQDPRDKAGAKARFEMHRLEQQLIEEFAPDRRLDEWTIIDGEAKCPPSNRNKRPAPMLAFGFFSSAAVLLC